MSACQDAARVVGAVAAPGTDPDRLLAVLCWAVRPRRTVEGLRRRCADPQESVGLDVSDPSAALAAAAGLPAAHLAAAAAELAGVWRRLGVRVALVGDPAYPRRLSQGWPTTPAPGLLAWRGQPPDDDPAVAVVGARRASGYGLGVAAWLAEAAADAGVRVVSGGAQGIDAAAHEAALEAPGGTSVVLGCGHAVDYPRPHAAPGGLFDRVLDHGGTLLSELLPHQSVHPGTVRARNRIVAGLADAVVVVEGGERSGSLLTASAAADLDRPVLAVPGDVRLAGSAAPHRLLGEGAAPCTSPADLLTVVGRGGVLGVPDTRSPTATPGATATAGAAATPSPLPAAVEQVLRASWPRPVRLDDLARRADLAAGPLLAALTRARVLGLVAQSTDGVRLRRPPPEARPGRTGRAVPDRPAPERCD